MSMLPDTFVGGLHDVDRVKKMPYRPLGKTGLVVSALSFGASSLGSVFRATDDSESVEIVKEAVQSGINYIDTAPWYGQGKSESVLGKVLPTLPRSSYYLSTKVGRYEKEVTKMFDFSAERTLKSIDESLQRLNLDYVDVIQIHDMEFAPSLDVIINETLPALKKVKDAGKAKFIGITGYPLENFNLNVGCHLFKFKFIGYSKNGGQFHNLKKKNVLLLRTVIERSTIKIDVVLTYCRGSMNDNSLKDWLPYFQSCGVGVVNASPISMGLLSNRGPPSWHPATDSIRQACAQAALYCQEHDVDISRLGLKFTLDQEDIPTTLISTASLENLKKNLESVYTPLSDHERIVLQDVLEKFMKPLQNANWEGVEVAEYRRQLMEALEK
ncbi:unnamed protein product [Lymnaea stagnalis]|uniref:NADP-dependent oxidoreductase domain-containing protein n=1 Tax=Lymnaea stagnalis TaxID=6523 RepID=A0AAV2HZA6_LYMST